MITVIETWSIKQALQAQAKDIMQAMDDLLGPGAHAHPGWQGHASFFQRSDRPEEVVVLYPWESIESHRDLCERESEALPEFYEKYCNKPREIKYFSELLVDVDGGLKEDPR
jgi:hypothetical protein